MCTSAVLVPGAVFKPRKPKITNADKGPWRGIKPRKLLDMPLVPTKHGPWRGINPRKPYSAKSYFR